MTDKALTLLDDTFADYLMKKSSKAKFEKDIASALRALPFEGGEGKEFTITVINEDRKSPFFGFSVYPVIDILDKVAEYLVITAMPFKDLCKRWASIPNWCIEIDAQCFDRAINFNPKELTAMLLHEIGHVIYSEKPVERWYRAYREAQMRVKLADRTSLKVLYSLYSMPLAISCMQRNWVNSKNRIRVEYAADKTTAKYGYGDALVSALDKIIKSSGSINQSDAEKDHEVQSSIDWCNVNSLDLTHRKNKLKDELFYQSLRTNSGYFKALGLSLLNKLGVKLKEKYTGEACEMTIEMLYDPDLYTKYNVSIDSAFARALDQRAELLKSSGEMDWAMEAFGRKKKLKKLPSQYDIDCIEIEIDKITNHYDRTYVLDLIYKQLDDIEIFEGTIENDPNKCALYAPKIAQMRKTLDEYRLRCLAKKNLDKQYKFFVKYPEGYEG